MLSRLFGKKNKATPAPAQPLASVISQEEMNYAFHFAVQSHDLAKAQAYAAQGADINAAPHGHTPPLISSLREKQPDITDWLLTQKPDLELRDRLDKTALMTAMDNGADWTEKILKAGASLHTKNAKGWTALEYALRQKHTDSARVLIDAAAAPNAPLSDGSTPADYARDNGMAALADQIDQKEQDKIKAAAEALKPETNQPVTVMKRIRLKKDGLNT